MTHSGLFVKIVIGSKKKREKDEQRYGAILRSERNKEKHTLLHKKNAGKLPEQVPVTLPHRCSPFTHRDLHRPQKETSMKTENERGILSFPPRLRIL